MSRPRWTLRVDVEPDQVIVRGWRAVDILRSAGLRPLWSARQRGWVLDNRRAADAVAAVEASGAAVVVTGLPIEPKPVPAAPTEDPQLSLFGGGDAA